MILPPIARSHGQDLAGEFHVGEQKRSIARIEIRMDGGEHRVRIALGALDVAERDIEKMDAVTIGAGRGRRAKIAPTNSGPCHVPRSRLLM